MLFAIILIGFVLRVWGIGFGLPDLFHADEPTAINMAMAMGQGDLNPHAFWKPALLYYLLLLEFGLYYIIGLCMGMFSNTMDFVRLFLNNPTSFYIIARITTGAIMGSLTIIPAYLLGKRCFSKRVGMLSALFLSVNFLHVRNSHYAWHDIPMALFISLSFLWIYNIYDKARIRDYIISGIMAAIATAFKYNAVILVVPILCAHILKTKEEGRSLRSIIFDIRIAYCVAAFLVIFFLYNPFLLLDIKGFLTTFRAQASVVGFTGYYHHLRHSIVGGMGLAQVILVAVGTIFALYKYRNKAIILISFLAVYYVSIVYCGQPHERYIIPIIPLLAIFSGVGCATIGGIYKKRRSLLYVIAVIALLQPLLMSVYTDYLFSSTDTRREASEYVEENVPEGEKIAMTHTFFSPQLKPTIDQIRDKREYLDSAEALSSARAKKIELMLRLAKTNVARYRPYYIYESGSLGQDIFSGYPALDMDAMSLLNEDISYVFAWKPYPEFKLEGKFYNALNQHYKVSKVFNPFKDNKTGMNKVSFFSPTAAGFASENILTRKRSGPILILYKRR